MPFERLRSDVALAQLDAPEPVWIFKHSLTCPVSARAMLEVSTFARRNPRARVVLIEVQRERALSRTIAKQFKVPHASPQVILAANGTAVWHTSHFGVSVDALEQSLADIEASAPSRRPA